MIGAAEPPIPALVLVGHSAPQTAVGYDCPSGSCWAGAWGPTGLEPEGNASFPAAAIPVRGMLSAEWTATTPAGASLQFRLFVGDRTAVRFSGTSPLVADLPPEALTNETEYVVLVGPDHLGVMVDERVDFRLELAYE